jgi:hypothetical protein
MTLTRENIASVDALPDFRPQSRAVPLLAGWSGVFFLGCLLAGTGYLISTARLPVMRWPKSIDDMYYYFLLVRQSLHNGIVSVDGVRHTNGFHPLYFLLLRGIYPYTTEAHLPTVAVTLLTLFHAATGVTLWLTLRRLAGRILAGLLAGVYAANPFILGVVLQGMETPIACFFAALGLWAYLRWMQQGRTADRMLMLVALPLAVFARTDTLFLGIAIALTPLFGAGRHPFRDWRRADFLLMALCALPVLLFMAWSWRDAGELLQTSGRAHVYWQSVGFWVDMNTSLQHFGMLRAPLAALGFLACILAAFPTWIISSFYYLLSFHPLGWMLLGARAMLSPLRSNAEEGSPPARLGRSLLLFLALFWGFYAVFFRRSMEWYWHTSVYSAALLVGLWVAPLRQVDMARFFPLLTHRRFPALAVAGYVLALSLIGLSFNTLKIKPAGLRSYTDIRSSSVPLGEIVEAHAFPLTGAVHSLPPSRPLLAVVPRGAVVGIFDSGAVGWDYPELQIVNLDGLVNNSAYRAIRKGEIGRYMLDAHIEYFVSHENVIRRFLPFGLQEYLDNATFLCRWDNGVMLYRAKATPGNRN